MKLRKVVQAAAVAAAILIGCLSAKRQASADTGDWAGAQKAVVTAYKNYETEVDVTKFNLNYKTEYDSLKSMMEQVVNQTPYLFYTATSYTVSRNTATNQIVKIGLGYTDRFKKPDGSIRKKKIRNIQDKINIGIEQALSDLEPSMTKVEKALVIHDYLVSNTTYTKNTENDYRLTEEGVFVKHQANCQGYSLAYAMLMEKVGIPVEFVVSDNMSHMWNKIKIGGSWYHVDVTWDDPVDASESKDQYGLVNHNNFLCSSEKMTKNGHNGFDTEGTDSTKYDNKYWKNVTSSFYYRDGKWLYLTKKGIMERDRLQGGSKEVLYNVSGRMLSRFDSDKYYFIAYNNIYIYDYTSNSAQIVWKTSSKYPKEYTLTQIRYSDGKIYYRLLNGTSHVSGILKTKEDGFVSNAA